MLKRGSIITGINTMKRMAGSRISNTHLTRRKKARNPIIRIPERDFSTIRKMGNQISPTTYHTFSNLESDPWCKKRYHITMRMESTIIREKRIWLMKSDRSRYPSTGSDNQPSNAITEAMEAAKAARVKNRSMISTFLPRKGTEVPMIRGRKNIDAFTRISKEL